MGLKKKDELTLIHDYYRALIENSVDLIFILDAEAIITFISPSIERVLGYSPEEVIGTCAFGYIQFDEIKKAKSMLDRMKTDHVIDDHFEFHVEHKDGHWLQVELVGVNHLDHPGINGIVVNARDITRRKIMEEELRRSEERFGLIVDSISEVISITDIEGNINYIGKPIYQVLGYEPEEMEALNLVDLVHPDDLGRIILLTLGVGEKHGDRASFRCRVRSKDGQWRHIEGNSINHSNNPAIAGIVSVTRDVNDRIMAEEAHEEAMNAFINNTSNEFRQVVTILKGYSALLKGQRDHLDEETQERMLETIESSSDRLDELIKGLPDMSRKEQGRFGIT
jgi:PAS domain S-box-containing protein